MHGRQKRFEKLDLQLEAISDALAMAREEPSPERRGELLTVVERALAAYHEEHKAAMAERPRFRVLHGGAAVVALTAVAAWLREIWGTHRPITVGTVAVAATIGVGLLLFGLWRGGAEHDPPVLRPTVTAPPPRDTPTPTATETVTITMSPTGSASPPATTSSTRRPPPEPTATGGPSPSPSPSASFSPGPVEPSPSRPGRGRGTDAVPPPGLEEGGDEEDGSEDGDDRGDHGGRPQGESCLLDVDLPGVDVDVDRLVCL